MAKATYVHKGASLDYTNETNTIIEANDIIAFEAGIGVAGTVIAPGALGSVYVVGVFDIPKAAEEIAFGALLYYDEATGTVSTDDEGTPCGYAAAYSAATAATACVRIG